MRMVQSCRSAATYPMHMGLLKTLMLLSALSFAVSVYFIVGGKAMLASSLRRDDLSETRRKVEVSSGNEIVTTHGWSNIPISVEAMHRSTGKFATQFYSSENDGLAAENRQAAQKLKDQWLERTKNHPKYNFPVLRGGQKKKKRKMQIPPDNMFVLGSVRMNNDTVDIVDVARMGADDRPIVLRLVQVRGVYGVVLSYAILEIPKELPLTDDVPGPVNTSQFPVNPNLLLMTYLRYMVASAFTLGSLTFGGSAMSNVLSIGLGGGSINNYLRRRFPNINVTAVEIEPVMLEIAKKYFGFVADERHSCVIADGVKYVEECAQRGRKFDVIFLDACLSGGGRAKCPVPAFHEKEAVRHLSGVLNEAGVLLVNYFSAGYDESAADLEARTVKTFELFFTRCAIKDVFGTGNKCLVCVKKWPQEELLNGGHFDRALKAVWSNLSFDYRVYGFPL